MAKVHGKTNGGWSILTTPLKSNIATQNSHVLKGDILVGGFNPSKKYWSHWIISPSGGEHENMNKTTNPVYLPRPIILGVQPFVCFPGVYLGWSSRPFLGPNRNRQACPPPKRCAGNLGSWTNGCNHLEIMANRAALERQWCFFPHLLAGLIFRRELTRR